MQHQQRIPEKNIISETDTRFIVDPMKIFRERERVRSQMDSAAADQQGTIQAPYIGGRKDKAFTGKSTTRKEEHVAVMVEPDSRSHTHFTPESGKAIH